MTWVPPIELGGEVSLGLASHDEVLAAVPELDRLSERAVPRRRADFLAGRHAARRALAARGVATASIRIDANQAGRPIAPSGFLSISHAEGRAIAAASRVPVGIDLVAIEDLPDAMAEDVFAAGELDGIAACLGLRPHEARARCVAFAIKEAALKWLGVGMGVPPRTVRVEPLGALFGSPARSRARLVHTDREAELDLVLFALEADLWCVLLFGR